MRASWLGHGISPPVGVVGVLSSRWPGAQPYLGARSVVGWLRRHDA